MEKVFLVLVLGVLSFALWGDGTKLVNVERGCVIVEFKDHRPVFYDHSLKSALKWHGIFIPPSLREKYGGKVVVLIKDEEFERAFKELFVPNVMGTQIFQWKD